MILQFGPFVGNPLARFGQRTVAGVIVDLYDSTRDIPDPGRGEYTGVSEGSGIAYINVPSLDAIQDYNVKATFPAGAYDPELPDYVREIVQPAVLGNPKTNRTNPSNQLLDLVKHYWEMATADGGPQSDIVGHSNLEQLLLGGEIPAVPGTWTLYLNGTAVGTTNTYSPQTANLGGPLIFGDQISLGHNHNYTQSDARFTSIGYWTRTLAASDITAQYNSGNGKKFANLTDDEKVSLINWWNCNEDTGDRIDIVSSAHLRTSGFSFADVFTGGFTQTSSGIPPIPKGLGIPVGGYAFISDPSTGYVTGSWLVGASGVCSPGEHAFTFALWMYGSSVNAADAIGIVSKGNTGGQYNSPATPNTQEWQLWYGGHDGHGLKLGIGPDGEADINHTFDDTTLFNTWSHIAITYTPGVAAIPLPSTNLEVDALTLGSGLRFNSSEQKAAVWTSAADMKELGGHSFSIVCDTIRFRDLLPSSYTIIWQQEYNYPGPDLAFYNHGNGMTFVAEFYDADWNYYLAEAIIEAGTFVADRDYRVIVHYDDNHKKVGIQIDNGVIQEIDIATQLPPVYDKFSIGGWVSPDLSSISSTTTDIDVGETWVASEVLTAHQRTDHWNNGALIPLSQFKR